MFRRLSIWLLVILFHRGIVLQPYTRFEFHKIPWFATVGRIGKAKYYVNQFIDVCISRLMNWAWKRREII